jgi:undecaprenyl-diphosphatase
VLSLVILALVQGLTEFLPVSSTGHLLFAQYFLGVERSGLVIEAVMHLGTAAATVVMFRHDFIRLIRAIPSLFGLPSASPEAGHDRRLLVALLLATSVTGALGLTFAAPLERVFDSVRTTAVLLLVTGVILLAHRERGTRDGGDATAFDGLALGAAQAVSILPGISRSGITIITGLLLGFRRTEAARVSFLMSVPSILGAGIYGLQDAGEAARMGFTAAELITGGVVAALGGALAIAWLLDIVRRQLLTWFSVYCWLAGLTVLALTR